MIGFQGSLQAYPQLDFVHLCGKRKGVRQTDETYNFDSHSDDQGPEPEALALGEIDGRTYAFVELGRIGGVMVWQITDPRALVFVQYAN